MQLPTLTEVNASQLVTDVFGGYNHNMRIGDGEFYDMQNMTSEYYPVLSPRNRRGVYKTSTLMGGLIAKENICYVAGNRLYVGDTITSLLLDPLTMPKQLISMGAYIIILPDKMYINTADISDYGSIEATVNNRNGSSYRSVTFTPCDAEGKLYAGNGIYELTTVQPPDFTTNYANYYNYNASTDSYVPCVSGIWRPNVTYRKTATIGGTEPTNPFNGDVWIDNSVSGKTVTVVYYEVTRTWVNIAQVYFTVDGISTQQFKEGDTITLTVDDDVVDSGDYYIIKIVDSTKMVLVGVLSDTKTISDKLITVARTMPIMDYVIESQNRLWGCRYGLNSKGEWVNEIYASKLGDFKNWYSFRGISTDSYIASCGTDGKWTGAVNYLGYPLFFKENHLHKVFGSYPSQYQIQDTACRGVEEGSSKSLAIVNETLFYKSRGGICAYDGSLPTDISTAFGEVKYNSAVGGAHDNKYFVSMKDKANKYNLFVFDTAKNLWHREDDLKVDEFASLGDEMYYLDTAHNIIGTIYGSGTTDTNRVKWMTESGILGVDAVSKKYISQINLRMSLDIGSSVQFYIQYDSMGEWEHVCTYSTTSLRSFNVPIRPKRCDHFRLRMYGEGDAKIFSLAKVLEAGSDL